MILCKYRMYTITYMYVMYISKYKCSTRLVRVHNRRNCMYSFKMLRFQHYSEFMYVKFITVICYINEIGKQIYM